MDEFNIYYHISLRGNYDEITPSPENVQYFIDHFLNKGFIPSVFAEYKLEFGDNPLLIPKTSPMLRLKLTKGDNSWNINLLTSKIDFILANNDISTFKMPDFNFFIAECKDFIKIISDRFPNRHQQIGVIRNYLLSGQDLRIQRKFVNNPPVFDKIPLQQWMYKTVTKKRMSNEVDLNLISDIQKITTPITNNSQKTDFEGIQCSFEVNTINDNVFRFDSLNVCNSIDNLVNVLSNTINETFKYLKSDE